MSVKISFLYIAFTRLSPLMRKLFFALIFLLAFYMSAFCQNSTNASVGVVAKLKSFYAGSVIEKAYLHFDRPYYVAGDTVYFKAYVTFGEQHELSSQSGILNVDLLNPQNNILRSLKLPMKDGVSWGDFTLPASLPKGYYRIRAYTRLMRDAGLTDIFEQTIPVGAPNGNNVATSTIVQNTNKPAIQFFPEGGNLINGVSSKLAFKAIGADGLGLNVKGLVLDDAGKTVATFNSTHLGMGFFNLQPEDGKAYKAQLTFADGTQSTSDLPAAEPKGITMALDNDDPDVLKLAVSCNRSYFDENQNKELSVVINSGVAVSKGRIKLGSPLFATDLKKSQFRTGVVQFTLFSPEGVPLCERLVFINRPDLLKLSVNTTKATFGPREKVAVSLTSKNKDDSLVRGHFSVAVINETKVQVDENKENTILSWLLLNSDVKGYIEQPNYYFAHTNVETSANLDVLMLTQGFRRFVWKQLLDDKYPPFIAKPESSLQIGGLVTGLTGKPIIKEKVTVVSLQGGPILNQVTDSAGRFNFTGLDFIDGASFMVRAGSEKNKNNTKIIFDKEQHEPLTNAATWPHDYTNLDSLAIAMQRQVQIDKTKNLADNEKPLYKTESLAGAGNADQVLHSKDLGDGVLLNKLAVLLNGVVFYGDSAAYLRQNLHATFANPKSTELLLIIDGVKSAGVSDLNSIQTTDVETVELLKNENASAYGAEGIGGVLIVTTKRGKDGGDITANGVVQISPIGFYKAREFYSPKYESTASAAGQPDLRSTIYWKPELETDKNGNASFNYYNADGKGTYRIVIEGIDSKGNLGRQVIHYKVE